MKKKIVRGNNATFMTNALSKEIGNNATFMTKALSKEIVRRSKLKKTFNKNPT